ncbi:hypothetical protein [Salibacterium lacus]|uniref:Uncharacterized protein n=1 Tax=Salibacterium lacus TaxID=1898109 RepID=A0ABW5SY57_9BACI
MPEHNESKPITRCRDCAYFAANHGTCELLAVFADKDDGCTFGDRG